MLFKTSDDQVDVALGERILALTQLQRVTVME